MNEDYIVEFIPNRFAKAYEVNRSDAHSIYKKESVEENKQNDITYDQIKDKISTGEISVNNPLYKPKPKKTALSTIWSARGEKFKCLQDIPFDQPVLVCNWSGLHEEVLNRLESVYQIIDRQTKKIYNQSIKKFMYSTNTTKYDLSPIDTYLYHGKNIKHIKIIQKKWIQSVDMRSFKTLDTTYSKKLGVTDPETASIYMSTIGYILANNNHPSGVVISGMDLDSLNPSEQVILNNNNLVNII